MSTDNICLYKEVARKYTCCNLKTTELLKCALIGVCAVIRSNTVCSIYSLFKHITPMLFFHLAIFDFSYYCSSSITSGRILSKLHIWTLLNTCISLKTIWFQDEDKSAWRPLSTIFDRSSLTCLNWRIDPWIQTDSLTVSCFLQVIQFHLMFFTELNSGLLTCSFPVKNFPFYTFAPFQSFNIIRLCRDLLKTSHTGFDRSFVCFLSPMKYCQS